MSETIYAKCACDHCGGHIEFPSEAADRSISCPHCGTTTILSISPAKPARPKRRRWGRIAGVALAAFGLAAVFVIFGRWREQRSAPGLKASVASFTRASTNRPGAVAGAVENGTARLRQGVRVEIELLNSRGEPLWSTTAFTPALDPNKSWTFRADVLDPNAVTARVARVRELGR